MSEPFQLEGYAINRDERGLVSVQVPVWAATENETLTVTPPNGAPFGLPETNRSVSAFEAELGYQVTITYEGAEKKDKDSEAETYEFDSSFKEEPIESHPAWSEIKTKFGGSVVDKEVTFPETLPRSQISTAGLTGNEPTTQVRNPMFGIKTYLALYVVFRRTYVKKNIPKGLLDAVGTTRDKLPAGLPTPKGRNWLIMPPKIRKRGNAWEITEELTLSKPGEKWPAAVHKLIQK